MAGDIYDGEGNVIGRKDMSDSEFLAPILDPDRLDEIEAAANRRSGSGKAWAVRDQDVIDLVGVARRAQAELWLKRFRRREMNHSEDWT